MGKLSKKELNKLIAEQSEFIKSNLLTEAEEYVVKVLQTFKITDNLDGYKTFDKIDDIKAIKFRLSQVDSSIRTQKILFNTIAAKSGTKEYCLVAIEELEKLKNHLMYQLPKQTSIANKITPMNIAIFCRILNQSKIKKQELSDQATFCKTVCNEYNLKYTERVRINYSQNGSPTKKQIDNMLKVITNKLPSDIINDISKYINKESGTKQNLYA